VVPHKAEGLFSLDGIIGQTIEAAFLPPLPTVSFEQIRNGESSKRTTKENEPSKS